MSSKRSGSFESRIEAIWEPIRCASYGLSKDSSFQSPEGLGLALTARSTAPETEMERSLRAGVNCSGNAEALLTTSSACATSLLAMSANH